MRGNRSGLIEIGGQKCRVEVALHRPDTTGALVPARRVRFFHRLAAAVAKLRQFGGACGNLGQGAARACNGAFQETDKHPWSSQSHTLAVLFLPAFVRNLFEDDRVAHRHDGVDPLAMQALALSRQFAFGVGFPAPDFLVGAAALPVQFLLAVLLDATLCIVVVGMSRPTLPIHLALESTDFLLMRGQLLTEQLQACFGFAGYQSDA